MGRMLKAALLGGATLTMAALLTGCTAGETYAIFDREAQASDALPDAVLADGDDVIDPDTSRFVGEDGDVSLWLARPAQPGGACIVAYRSDEVWLTGCGSQVEISGEVGPYAIAPDGFPAPEGMTRLFDNIYAAAD